MLRIKLGASLALLLALVAVSRASIENEPVKVTHRNSGPRYDIDEVERTRLNQAAAANEVAGQPPAGSGGDGAQPTDEQPAIGHISIRRIFLVPVMPHHHGQEDAAGSGPDSLLWSPPRSSQSSRGGGDEQSEVSRDQQQMGPFRRPSFWPFMPPPSPLAPSRHQHLFGADKASRSPTAEASEERPQSSFGAGEGEGERETSLKPPGQGGPAIDPIQMLVDLMHQALNPGMQTPSGNNFFTDLNKEASASRGSQEQDNNRQGAEASGLANRKPASQNETREDIVEIEGKKFLRKAIINRHQGDNIIFMTKRLIFIPLNETESTAAETTTAGVNSTPAAPASTASPAADQDGRRARPEGEEATTTTNSPPSTTTTITEAPIQASSEPKTSESPITSGTQEGAERGGSASSGAPSAVTTESSVEETTTPKESLMRKLSESFERAAERLLDSAANSTTEQPGRAPQNGV